MRRDLPRLLLLLALVTLTCNFPQLFASEPDTWSRWRGPLRTGESPTADPPIKWSEESNVRWKKKLPGLGHSSPVVWGDRIFLTSAIPYGRILPPVPVTAPGAHDNLDVTQKHRFVVLCYRRSTGDLLWQKTVNDLLPHEGGHYTGSLASASPVTDGKHVYAWFGSHGLFALDFDGEVVWEHKLPKLQSKHAHGEGASFALEDGILVLNCDHEHQSFIRTVNAETGKTIWEKERDEVTSWASPLIVNRNEGALAVVAGTDRIRAYDLKNGEVVWSCGGLSANVVATPVASGDILIAASSYDTRAMVAINMKGAKGDLTGTDHVLWTTTQRTPYVPSMLLVNDHVWFLRHYQNILSRRNIKTGEESIGPFRLPGVTNMYASPVSAEGRIYITDLDGRTLVFKAGAEPAFLALNRLDDRFAATPALVGGDLVLRGHEYLYCIADDKD